MMAATVLSGPQLYILGSAMVYHQPILWSAAMAAAFNLVIVRTVFGFNSLRGRDLVSLAALSGLAINTRPIGGRLLICEHDPAHCMGRVASICGRPRSPPIFQ